MKQLGRIESKAFARIASLFVILQFIVGCTNSGGGALQGFQAVRSSAAGNAIDINKALQIDFNEDVDPTTLNAYTVSLWDNDNDVFLDTKLVYDVSTRVLKVKPYLPLSYATRYRLSVNSQVRNTKGEHIVAEADFAFITSASPMTADYFPSADAIGINPRTKIRVQFAHGVDMNTVTKTSFLVNELNAAGVVVKNVTGAITKDLETHTAVFTPTQRLVAGTAYSYTLTSEIRGSNGASLYPNQLINKFTTWNSVGFGSLIGTSQDDYVNGVGHLAAGQIVLGGTSWGAINSKSERFDGDGFLTAINAANGDRDWTIQVGNKDVADGINAIAVVGNAIYVTGFTDGSFAKTQIKQGDTSRRHLFIAKYVYYDYEPTFMWVNEIGSSGEYLLGWNIVADESSVFVTAQGSGNLQNSNAIGGSDVYVFKLDASTGQPASRWPRVLGTNTDDFVQGMTQDANFIYVTGDTLGDWINPSAGHKGLTPFLLKLAKNGDTASDVVVNTQTAAANAQERLVMSITADTSNNPTTIYMAGKARNDNKTFAFIEKYSASGDNIGTITLDDPKPLLDESATALFAADGKVFVGINIFSPSIDGNLDSPMNSLTGIYRIDGDKLTILRKIKSDMHANIRDMVMHKKFMYMTGIAHGVYNGEAPLGSSDIFTDGFCTEDDPFKCNAQ